MGREASYNQRMPSRERRTIYREMAKGELRRGPLTTGATGRLVAYAARLGIQPTESVELIADAARDLGMASPSARAVGKREMVAFGGSPAPRLWLTVSILAVVAAISQWALHYAW